MPYIALEHRKVIDDEINALIDASDQIVEEKIEGALVYMICRLTMGILEPKGYAQTSNALGHIASAEAEIRRRVLFPYEDKCIDLNGDLKEFKKDE